MNTVYSTVSDSETLTILCPRCQEESIALARWSLGYRLCLKCGDKEATTQRSNWTVVPLHKSSYMLITDRSLLKQLNKVTG